MRSLRECSCTEREASGTEMSSGKSMLKLCSLSTDTAEWVTVMVAIGEDSGEGGCEGDTNVCPSARVKGHELVEEREALA